MSKQVISLIDSYFCTSRSISSGFSNSDIWIFTGRSSNTGPYLGVFTHEMSLDNSFPIVSIEDICVTILMTFSKIAHTGISWKPDCLGLDVMAARSSRVLTCPVIKMDGIESYQHPQTPFNIF